jgi:hypothetical protein
MNERQPNPAPGNCGKRTAATRAAAQSRPEPIAISPAVGPIPPVSVPLTPPAEAARPPRHAAVRAARRLLGWAARRATAARRRGDTRQE